MPASDSRAVAVSTGLRLYWPELPRFTTDFADMPANVAYHAARNQLVHVHAPVVEQVETTGTQVGIDDAFAQHVVIAENNDRRARLAVRVWGRPGHRSPWRQPGWVN